MSRRRSQRAPVKVRIQNGLIIKTDGFGGVSWTFDDSEEGKYKGREPKYKLVEVIGLTESYKADLELKHRIWRKAVRSWLRDAYRANAKRQLDPLRVAPREARTGEITEPGETPAEVE